MKSKSDLIKRINGFVIWLSMGISWAIYWFVGFLGFLGFLGYFWNEPSYYVFFGFFLNFYLAYRDKAKGEVKINLYKISTWFGSVLIILACIGVFTGSMDYILGVIIFLGLFAFMTSFLSYIGMEEPKDERLRKIGSLSATYSWYMILLLVSSLLVGSLWSGDEYIRIDILGFILVAMVITMIGGNIYFNRKGDVE